MSWLNLLRAAHFAALMTVFGRQAFALYARPWAQKNGQAGLIWLALAAGIAWLGLLLVDLAGGLADALRPDTLRAFLLATSFGPAWLVHLSAIAANLLVARMKPGPGPFTLALAVLSLITLSPIGHAARLTGGAEIIALLVHSAHLLAAGLWLGGLWGLAATLPRLTPDDSIRLLHRFSSAATLAVTLLLVTGLIKTANAVPEWSALATSDWGKILALKLALIALMLGLAAASRFLLLPRFEGMAAPRTGALICHLVVAEAALGPAVVLAAAILGASPPPG